MINVIEYLESSAERFPDKTAFADPAGKITFSELKKCSRLIASYLLKRGITSGSAVAFYMEKSVQSAAAMLGAVYANAFYSYIDIRQTPGRTQAMLEKLDPFVIVTDEENLAAITGIWDDAKIITVSGLIAKAQEEPEDHALLEKARSRFYDTQILYVNFTSGSTGIPKGVAVSHRSVIDFITQLTGIFGINEDDVIANQAPFDFDVSVKDFYSGLCCGASVWLIPREYFSNPAVLMDYLCESRATTLIWAVSAMCFVSIMNGFEYKTPETIKRVMFSGEIMPVKQLDKWQSFLPDAMFVNLYGPTEITCNCTYYILERKFEKDEIIPIGIPFPNELVFLLDENDKEVTAPGAEGEICVAGTCLALGYYKDPEKTAAAFCANPLNTATGEIMYRTGDLGMYSQDGNLIYTSRKDFQIKHMGQRIELGDIEASAMSLDGVDRACAIYDMKKKKIILFFAGHAGKDEVTKMLADKLPPFMMPGRTIKLESFPMNKNGKIDRHALEEMK